MICPLCKRAEARELAKYRNANLTRVRCTGCLRHSIVNVSQLSEDGEPDGRKEEKTSSPEISVTASNGRSMSIKVKDG